MKFFLLIALVLLSAMPAMALVVAEDDDSDSPSLSLRAPLTCVRDDTVTTGAE